MVKKGSIWLVVLISVMALAFIVSGCSKKQMARQEGAGSPMAKAEAVPETPPASPLAPAPWPEAKVEAAPAPAPAPAPAAKEEAAPAPAAKAEALDLSTLRILFAFDGYQLSAQSKENLEKISAWMLRDPNVKLQIQGNTCDIGTAEYNLALGEQRANSAKKYLEGLVISSARLSTISYGKERPTTPNTNEANRSENRRDEFVESK